MSGTRTDPLSVFRFRVEIDVAMAPGGVIAAGFSECSGLQADTETVEYREGGLTDHVHRFRGQTRFPSIVLRRGLATDTGLWDWYAAVMAGFVSRRNASISLMDAGGNVALRWNVAGAYPVKWTGPDLKAESGALAIEGLELVHTGFTVEQGP